MIYEIKNETLTAKINSLGAELFSVMNNKTCTEFIWQGDEKYWKGRSPVLFPFCGRNLDGCYYYNNEKYEILIHGLARYNEFSVHKQAENSITLKLVSNDETLKIYPFSFEFFVTFSLNKNELTIEYEVHNMDTKEMIFAYGFHPGFNVPIDGVGKFEDYYLEFTKDKYPRRQLIKGLDARRDEMVEFKNNIFKLTHEAFNYDQFFKSESDVVTLKTNLNNNHITVRYNGMTSLGLWKAENSDAPYVCIEPWHGFPGSYDKCDSLETRKEMIHLESGKEFKNSIAIEFYLEH